eukprot:g6136.t1
MKDLADVGLSESNTDRQSTPLSARFYGLGSENSSSFRTCSPTGSVRRRRRFSGERGSKRRREYFLGIFFLLLVVAIWNAATYLIKFIYIELKFNGPYFLTWVSNSIFVAYLPLICASNCINSITAAKKGKESLDQLRRMSRKRSSAVELEIDNTSQPQRSTRENDFTNVDGGEVNISVDDDNEELLNNSGDDSSGSDLSTIALASKTNILGFPVQMGTFVALRAAIVVSPFWFSANFAYNTSLKHTSVASNTIISTTSGLFTFLISVVVGTEHFTKIKAAGVLFNLLGAAVIGLASLSKKTSTNDSDNSIAGSGGKGGETIGGDLICLLSAFLYAVYSILIRMMLPEDDKSSTALFFGFLGACNAVAFGGGVLLVWLAGWEDYSMLSWKIIGYIVLNALFNNMLSDYLWARAMLLTSATVATVGLTLTIPAPLLIEAFQQGSLTANGLGYKMIGAVLVVAGFVCVAVDFKSIKRESFIRAEDNNNDDHYVEGNNFNDSNLNEEEHADGHFGLSSTS